MEKLKKKFGDLPIWDITSVHRRFLLQTIRNDSWPYRQEKLQSVQDWKNDIYFTRAIADSCSFGTSFVVVVKLENLKPIDCTDETQLNEFRANFKSPMIWTIMTGLTKNPKSVSDSEIYIPKLDSEPNNRSVRGKKSLRLVFKYKLFEI